MIANEYLVFINNITRPHAVIYNFSLRRCVERCDFGVLCRVPEYHQIRVFRLTDAELDGLLHSFWLRSHNHSPNKRVSII